jgi:prephenate dehydrogenase
VGLIGGSIGRAVRERKLAQRVVGVGRRESSLAVACDVGAVDRTTTDLTEGVAEAGLVVVCAPVAVLADLICQVAAACPAECLITDAGSTKAALVAEVERRLPTGAGPFFIGSHPLAGDHLTGPTNARANLLDGNKVVVTPTDRTDPAAVDAISLFWQSLGATVLQMSPAAHDEAVAVTSHLPHLAAFALASATPESMGPLAASGWRDTTRVAAADPTLWQQIFTSNDQAVLAALDRFEDSLSALRRAIADGDDAALVKLLTEAKQIRDALGN